MAMASYSSGQGYYFDSPFLVDPSLAPTASSAPNALATNVGPIMAIFGALQSGIGSYYSAKSTKSSLGFQSDMAAINARLAERTAQSILMAGEQEQGRLSAKAGQVKSKQKVSQAARGVQIGVGSAAEEVATTDLVKEMDMLTINANSVRQAAAARTQRVNAANESLLRGTTADSISPFAAGATDFLTGATKVASSWYRSKKARDFAFLFGE